MWLNDDLIESSLPQRIWREGWMCNKTLQKLHGTNAVIGFCSGLISVKLSATEIDLVPVPFRYY